MMNFEMAKEKEKEEGKSKGLSEKIAEKFLERRQVYLWGPVQDKSCAVMLERILYLENEDPGKPIYLFINSPGGVITSGMAVFDVIKMVSSPVYTITMGMAASMGAILFAAGEKGHRYIFEHAKVMIHQPLISGQIIAPALDIKIHADEIKKTRLELNNILAKATGKSLTQIEKDTDRDYYLNAKEAVEYGIADSILTDFSKLPILAGKRTSTPKKTSKAVKKTKS